ncbi:MAG TPA: hypothetical protein VF510_02995 [Ktedonobacterales bacterium]
MTNGNSFSNEHDPKQSQDFATDIEEPDYIREAFEYWDPDAIENDIPVSSETLEETRGGARHPTKSWQIMHSVDHDNRDHAWIRHIETGEVWRPDGATHMTWLRDGRELGMITEIFTPDPNKPDIIGSPLQSEFGYWFERWTWPVRERISSCPIGMRTGWPTELLGTPDPNVMFFEWYDQGESGYEGVILDDAHGDAQNPRESYEVGFPLIGYGEQTIFSPDARYLVRCSSLSFFDNAASEWERTLLVAYLVIVDRALPSVQEVPIYVTLPPRWTPPAQLLSASSIDDIDGNGPPRWVQSCAFVDDIHIVLHLLDGRSQTIAAHDASLATIPTLPERPPTPHISPDVDRETLNRIIAENRRLEFPTAKRLHHPREAVAITGTVWPSSEHLQWVENEDGRKIWDPGDAMAMVWLTDGHQVGLLSGAPFSYKEQVDQHVVFERRSWPERTLITQLQLPGWSGKLVDIAMAPAGDAVIVTWDAYDWNRKGWSDASSMRLHRIQLDPLNKQDRVTARTAMSRTSEITAQSPSGRWLLCLEPVGMRWPAHEAECSWRRRAIVGIASLYDWHTQQARDLALCEDFSADWMPPDLEHLRSPLLPWYYSTAIALIEDASFPDDQHLSVRFATKRTVTIPI